MVQTLQFVYPSKDLRDLLDEHRKRPEQIKLNVVRDLSDELSSGRLRWRRTKHDGRVFPVDRDTRTAQGGPTDGWAGKGSRSGQWIRSRRSRKPGSSRPEIGGRGVSVFVK
jgi:hypothetical protein